MPRVLLIGVRPEAVDLSDPSFPIGLTNEKVATGIRATVADMRERGWEPGLCAVHPDSVEADVAKSLTEKWDCIVVGAGIRIPAGNLLLFEKIVNTIILLSPGTPIAFNTSPENSGDAAARWLDRP